MYYLGGMNTNMQQQSYGSAPFKRRMPDDFVFSHKQIHDFCDYSSGSARPGRARAGLFICPKFS